MTTNPTPAEIEAGARAYCLVALDSTREEPDHG